MSGSHDAEREARHAQQEAAASTVTHRGPTADRHGATLERYVGVVSGEKPPAAAGTHFRWAAPRTVADVMTRDFTMLRRDAPVKSVVDALERNRGYAVPIIDEAGHLVGVATTSDVLARVAGAVPTAPGHGLSGHTASRRKQRARTAAELMSAPALTTTTATSVADAARLAARQRVRSLPVVSQAGEIVGMVSRDDLALVFLRSDADIERDVQANVDQVLWKAAQHRHPRKHTNRVHVAVQDGVVTLAGDVETALVARSLVHHAQQVVGVVGVNDLLEFEINDAFLPLGPS